MNREHEQNRQAGYKGSAKRNDLPEDVLNKEQDPASMKDPLINQLEKSKDQNAPAEARKLDELKKNEENA